MELTTSIVGFLLSFSLTTWLLLVTFVLLFVWFNSHHRFPEEFEKRNIKYVKMGNLFVNMLRRKRFELSIDEKIKEEGRVFGCRSLGSNSIFIAEPELLGQVFTKNFTTFTNRRKIATGDPIFNNFIVVLEGDRWKRCRSIMTPTFAMGKIRLMKNIVNETARTFVKNFHDAIQQKDVVEIKHLAGAFTMDTIVQIAFGVKIDSLTDKNNLVLKNAKKLFQTDLNPYNLLVVTLTFGFPRIAKALGVRMNGSAMDFFEKLSGEIIKNKRESFVSSNINNNTKPTNFIELLLEAENERIKLEAAQGTQENGSNVTSADSFEGKAIKFMTNDEIMAQCILFFMVGYDTTATTISLTLYNLALHPEIQQQLYEEIVTTQKELEEESGESDPFKLFTLDSIIKMKLLEACIKENLRLYPPGTMTERRASEDITLESDNRKIYVKKDDIIGIPIYSIQRDPEYWNDPEKFDPSRFLDGAKGYHKYSYIPFGAGPRDCIAKSLAYLEAKMAILHSIRCYKFERSPETQVPVQFYFNTNLVNKDINLRIVQR